MMRRRIFQVDKVLAFISERMRHGGVFPSHREISDKCGVARWQIANVLTYLVNRGDLKRRQVAEKGTFKTPKYVYKLVARAGDREGGAANIERGA